VYSVQHLLLFVLSGQEMDEEQHRRWIHVEEQLGEVCGQLVVTFQLNAYRIRQWTGRPHVAELPPRSSPEIINSDRIIRWKHSQLPVRLGFLSGLGVILQVGHNVLEHLTACAFLFKKKRNFAFRTVQFRFDCSRSRKFFSSGN
jgi:hypothetical protein